ncbi:MAG TPA: GDSL-type esterase/lipase family protein [Pyrinomonadaceae bacterium]|jgi:lysophospholipase L1-like esterase
MNCQSCGKKVRETARFCDACGVALHTSHSRIIIDLSAKKEEVALPAPLTPSFLFPQEVEKKRRFHFIPSRRDKQIKEHAPSNGKEELKQALKADAKPLDAASAPVVGKDSAASTEAAPKKEKRPRNVLLTKPAQTILCVLILAALPLFVPGLDRFREMLPDFGEMVSFNNGSSGAADSGIPGGAPASSDTTYSSTEASPVVVNSDNPIVDPQHAMDNFYASLARTDAKQPGAVTRVTHYGDSPITNDGITATVRRLLQTRFGDAGHGFILMDRPWAWYGHQAITYTSGGGWDNNPMMGGKTGDGMFGLGGVWFNASGAGKYARFAPATEGETGKSFSRMDVYYLQQSSGGQFSVSVNGANAQTVSTTGTSGRSGFFEIKAPQAGANNFEVRTAGGDVRLFGAVLENDGPGVVYDSLGVNGAYAGLLATVMNEDHWREQLQHRKPDLVVINYGTNESQYASADQMERYEKDLREVIRRVRAALPSASILILSPMDRGQRAAGGKIVTKPSIPMIVDMQRRVALDSGCAFFDTFKAMGGEGTMAKWYAGAGKNHYVGGDLTHPTAEGAEIVGRLIYEALGDGYSKYKARRKS